MIFNFLNFFYQVVEMKIHQIPNQPAIILAPSSPISGHRSEANNERVLSPVAFVGKAGANDSLMQMKPVV